MASGKGTQAEALSSHLGIPHLASGDLFRAALRDGTPLGERAKTYMDRGELVPDDITIDMFMEELGKPQASRGAILDGFPRTVAQAEALDQTLAGRGEKINGAIYIEVPSEELVSRVAGRSVCPTDGTVYHDVSDPPRHPGHLRPRRHAAGQARRRPAGGRARAAGQPGAADARRGEALRGCRACCTASTAGSRSMR